MQSKSPRMSPMRESLATALLRISISAPEQPTPTPKALRPVIGSFSISAHKIMAKIGNEVVTIAAFDGVVMLNPIVKQHWLHIRPNNPAPHNAKMSFKGTSSCFVNNDVSQNNAAPPAARRNTILRLSTPFCIASLPIGAISPQITQAEKMQRWAINARFFSIIPSEQLSLRGRQPAYQSPESLPLCSNPAADASKHEPHSRAPDP